MPRRLVDLSIAISNDVAADPAAMRPSIQYVGHRESFAQLAAAFPGLKPEDLPDGEAWAVETLRVSTHNGTHMDAPWHYHSTTDGGAPSPTIDQGPLDWFLRPAVKLDFRRFPDGYVATAADVQSELSRIGHELQPLDIVLVNTAAGAAYGEARYVDTGCGMGAEATLWLTAQGVRVVGTDAWSWDAPFVHTARRFAQTGDASIVWEGHKAGRHAAYYQMEKLHALEGLPPSGFTLSCFPVKIQGASAGWVRAVAIFDA